MSALLARSSPAAAGLVILALTLRNGTLVSTGGPAPSSEGVRIRLKRRRITVTDGPFGEQGNDRRPGRDRRGGPRGGDSLDARVHAAPCRALAGIGGECELRELVFLAS
jgi:hypothetical protein